MNMQKKRILLIGISMLGLGCSIAGFRLYHKKIDPTISFSYVPGFYEEAFYLEIIGGGTQNTIHYTMDGSQPNLGSPIYLEPILIEDASGHENIYSMRDDISICYQKDLIKQDGWPEGDIGYQLPDFLVDKCNIIRAASFDKDGNCLSEISGEYFVGFQNKNGYDKMTVVSIVTDQDNLFGYETGIYVLGKKFEDYFNSENRGWIGRTANYTNRGREWEREVIISIYDIDRKKLLSTRGGCSYTRKFIKNLCTKKF